MTSSNVGNLLVPSSHNLTFPIGFKVRRAPGPSRSLSVSQRFIQVQTRFFIITLQQMAGQTP